MGLEGHSIYTLYGPFVQLRNQHILDYTLWAIKNFVCKGDVHMRFLSINTTIKSSTYRFQVTLHYDSIPPNREKYIIIWPVTRQGGWFSKQIQMMTRKGGKSCHFGGDVFLNLVALYGPHSSIAGGTILDGQLFCHGSYMDFHIFTKLVKSLRGGVLTCSDP